MRITAHTLLVCFALAVVVSGQSPDQWKGLVLDKATPADATAALGNPKSESHKPDRYMAYRFKSLKDAKDLKILKWENSHGFDEVTLFFLDGTLAVIELEKPKEKLPAKVFVDAYESVAFEVGSQPGTSAAYEIAGTTDRSKIFAGVSNVAGSVARGLFGNIGTQGRITTLSGNIYFVLIQSRRMDDKRGVDALK